MRALADLFFAFMKIGCFTFGGGFAMLSLIERVCVQQKQWITHDDMMNVTVLAESTPGPIAVNCATFVGYRQKGAVGAAAATLGVVLPSFVIIGAIAFFMDRFLEIPWVAHAFQGIKLAVGILIADAAVKLLPKLKKNAFSLGVFGLSFIAMLLVDLFAVRLSVIVLMLAAAAAGLGVYLVKQAAQKRRTPR